jgi:hypothetical protein
VVDGKVNRQMQIYYTLNYEIIVISLNKTKIMIFVCCKNAKYLLFRRRFELLSVLGKAALPEERLSVVSHVLLKRLIS